MGSAVMSMIMDYYTGAIQAESNGLMFVGLAIAILFELLMSLIIMVFAALHLHDLLHGAPKNTSFRRLGEQVKPLTIESLRALTRMLLWSLLFLLPGLYQMLKLSFVNFVVLFDPRYEQGQIDALEESGVETRGLKRYLLLLLIGSFAIEFAAEWVRKSFLDASLFSALLAATLKLAFDIFTQGTTYALYSQVRKESK